jgi:flagellar basal body rod protein FlgB
LGETTLIDLSRMMALRTKLDVAANNVANLETAGFRAQQLSFQEYLAPIKGQEVGAKLREGRPESIETSSLHLDLLRDLKRIHSHICSVAYPVLGAAGELPSPSVLARGLRSRECLYRDPSR